MCLQALSEGFLDYLWKMLQNPNSQVVYRQAAAAYISSFLARATHVNIRYLNSILTTFSKIDIKDQNPGEKKTDAGCFTIGPPVGACVICLLS